MYGLARLSKHHPNERWLLAYANELRPYLARLPVGEVVNVLFAMVSLQYKPAERWLMVCLERVRQSFGAASNSSSSSPAHLADGDSEESAAAQRPEAELSGLLLNAAVSHSEDADLAEDPAAASTADPAGGGGAADTTNASNGGAQFPGPVEASSAMIDGQEATGSGALSSAVESAAAESDSEAELAASESDSEAESAAAAASSSRRQRSLSRAASASNGLPAPFSPGPVQDIDPLGPVRHVYPPGPPATQPISAAQLAYLAWCFDTLDFLPPMDWMDAYVAECQQHVNKMAVHHAVDVLHGLAGIDYLPPEPLLTALVARLQTLAAHMDADAVAKTMYALSRMNFDPEREFLDTCVQRSEKLMASFSGSGLSDLATGNASWVTSDVIFMMPICSITEVTNACDAATRHHFRVHYWPAWHLFTGLFDNV